VWPRGRTSEQHCPRACTWPSEDGQSAPEGAHSLNPHQQPRAMKALNMYLVQGSFHQGRWEVRLHLCSPGKRRAGNVPSGFAREHLREDKNLLQEICSWISYREWCHTVTPCGESEGACSLGLQEKTVSSSEQEEDHPCCFVRAPGCPVLNWKTPRGLSPRASPQAIDTYSFVREERG